MTIQDAAEQSRKLAAEADEIRQRTDKVESGMVEAERQILLIERKITLGKHTKMALDPDAVRNTMYMTSCCLVIE